MEIMTLWHNVRTDLEDKLQQLTGDRTISQGRSGNYKKDIFQGHCTANGGAGYLPLTGEKSSFRRLSELYGGN
jgi:hypothetical protein